MREPIARDVSALEQAWDVYAAFRKDARLSALTPQFRKMLRAAAPDRDLIHALYQEIPPAPQATDAFMDWSDPKLAHAYRELDAYLHRAAQEARVPRWPYGFEHLRIAQSLLNTFLAAALAGNAKLAELAKQMRAQGLKFSGKAVDYLQLPFSADRLRALKQIGFSLDAREHALSGKAVFRHAHGMFYPVILSGQGMPPAGVLARAEAPLRLRDAVDPEWLDMRDVYSAVKQGLAGQIEILEDLPEAVRQKAAAFIERQHWPELELVEDHWAAWAKGEYGDTLNKAFPGMRLQIQPQEIPLLEVGVRRGSSGPQQGLLHVERPPAQSGASRIAYVQRIGDSVLYNGFQENVTPPAFAAPYGPCLKIARILMRLQWPLLWFMGPVRWAKFLRALIGRDWARLLFIESPDEPWLNHTPVARKFRDAADGLLGPGAWKYFVDHRTLRFTGEIQSSILDFILFAPKRSDFDMAREALGALGFEERERYNPLNTDWEAQVLWMPAYSHAAFFLDKPLEGRRGKVAFFSAVWRSLFLFGINPAKHDSGPSNARALFRSMDRSISLIGPTPYFYHHVAIEGVFEEIGERLSRNETPFVLRKKDMSPEEIQGGFIARFSKKIARRQAFSLESRAVNPAWLLSTYVMGRLTREEMASLYEDAARHGGRAITVEGPHYENIDRRCGMHRFDQGKVDIAIQTSSEAKAISHGTRESWGARLRNAWRLATIRPAVSSGDLPLEVWVQDAGSCKALPWLGDLPRRLIQKDLADFGHDESRGDIVPIAAVLAPRDEKQLCEILKRYSAKGRALTIASANTGLSRGAVPAAPGEEVLSMRLFRRAPEIHHDAQGAAYAVVGAGIPLSEFQDFVESQGLYYPPDPTERSALLGGTIATNASGPRSFKYGPTRAWVKALRVALPGGEMLELRRGDTKADANGILRIRGAKGSSYEIKVPSYDMPPIKNAAGYYAGPGMDLIDLFIGSEGTLGVITQEELALLPKPPHRYSGNVYFPREQEAFAFVKAVKQAKAEGRLDPSLLEFFDEASVEIMRRRDAAIPPQAKAAIYFEQEIGALNAPALSEDSRVEDWRVLMDRCGALQLREAFSAEDRLLLRDLRHGVPEEVNKQIAATGRAFPGSGIRKVATDIAVPDDGFEEMLRAYRDVLAREGMRHVTWGHVGDNHLHVNMMPKDPAQFEKAKDLLLEFAREASRLHGTVTAEHGAGKIKIPQLKIMMGDKAMREMAAVKKVLDPAGILGRGTLFDKL